MSEEKIHLSRTERGLVRRATNRIFTQERQEFPSSSNPSIVYEATMYQNGRVQCNCRGWTIKKEGQARRCKHTDALINGRRTRDDGEYVYVIL